MNRQTQAKHRVGLVSLLAGLVGSSLLVGLPLPSRAQSGCGTSEIQQLACTTPRTPAPAPAAPTVTRLQSRPRPTPAVAPSGGGGPRPAAAAPVRTQQDVKVVLRETRPTVAAVPTGRTPRPIRFGEIVPRVLSQQNSLRLADGRWADLYQFQGTQGEAVALNLVGSADRRLRLDPYLVLFGPDGQVLAQDDDSGTDPRIGDARLLLRLPTAGTYTIMATAQPRDQGRYSLGLLRDTTRFLAEQEGELSARSNLRSADQTPFDVVEFQGKANQRVTILATSSQFDPYLFLLGPNGQVIAQDDDGGGDLNAKIELRLPTDGTYRVVVNSPETNARGTYRLTVN